MSKAREERIKLTANWLNIVGAGTVIAGIVTPVATLLYNLRDGETVASGSIILLTMIWLLAGLSLHLIAHIVLGRLDR